KRLHRAIQPAIFGGLQSWRAGFHEILRVEVRACFVRRAGRVDDREMSLIPERLESFHGGMQSEESIEIDGRELSRRRTRNSNRRTHGVVRLLAVRHDDVQTVRCAALKKHHQALLSRYGSRRSIDRPGEEARDRRGSHQRHCATLQECSSRDCHIYSSLYFEGRNPSPQLSALELW